MRMVSVGRAFFQPEAMAFAAWREESVPLNLSGMIKTFMGCLAGFGMGNLGLGERGWGSNKKQNGVSGRACGLDLLWHLSP